MGKKKLIIHKDRCKGCMLCLDVCPRKTLQMTEKINKRGSYYVVIVDPDKCTGCGLCYTVCPDCALEVAEE